MSKEDDDSNWDKNSENSDVSATTDIKVFHGAINGKNYLSEINKNTNLNVNKILHKNLLNKDNPENINNKFNLKNDKTQNKEKIIKNSHKNLLNLQGMSFNLFNNDIPKENINNKYEEKSLINSPEKNSELLSFRNESDIKENEIKNKNINKEEKQQLLIKFKDITYEDEEVINAGSVQIFEKSKKINSYQTMTNSQCSFKISTIEKGIALLVSSHDCIFTMPTFLLPKNAKIGNNYNFFIEEVNQRFINKNKINQLQKSYQKDIYNNIIFNN